MSASNADGSNPSREIGDCADTTKTFPTAIRTFDEAMALLIDDNAADVLPSWSTDDLSALLANIIRYQCHRSGVEAFIKHFDNTTVDEVLRSFDELRLFIQKASKERFVLPSADDGPSTSFAGLNSAPLTNGHAPLTSAHKPAFSDWANGAIIVSRARKVADETPVLLPKAITQIKFDGVRRNEPIADTPFMRCNNLLGAPNYEKMYQIVASMLSSRSVSKSRSLDAAIILNILDDLEEDASKFVEHIGFFAAAFQNIKAFDSAEFKVDTTLTAESIGKVSTNVFGLPSELFNLSDFMDDL